MTYLLAVGITVGLLAGAWVYTAGALTLLSFAGFLGWATYFASGGGKQGVIKSFTSNMSGVFWGVVTIWLSNTLAPYGVPSLIFTILFAAIMCWQAKIDLLGFIPGTFIGNAAYYASGMDIWGTALGLAIGIMLGLLSDVLAKQMSKKRDEKNAQE